MIFDRIWGFSSNDLGIDLGTATTLVYAKGKGIVLFEPSVIAIHKGSNTILAVGNEAKEMLGRTPASIVATRPLKDGVITDFEATEAMLRYFINKAQGGKRRFVHPRVVIAIASGITEAEKRAVKESATQAGAREVYLIEQPMAAAIGAGLPVQNPGGNMILDIGGGTSEVAVISLSGIVECQMIRIAGDEMNEAIIQHMKDKHNLMIGERTSEDVKIKIGSAFPQEEETTMQVKGRDLVSGLPKTLTISSEEVRDALKPPVDAILKVVKETLERTPPELAADLVDNGIVLAGGGSCLKGLDKLIAEKTGLPVTMAEDPFTSVAVGAGKCLDEIAFLRKIATFE